MGNFERALNNQQNLRDAESRELEKHQMRRIENARISGDASGTPPEQLFGLSGAEICNDFLRYAAQNNITRPENINFKRRLGGSPVWDKKANKQYSYTFMASILMETVWSGQGYTIGQLGDGYAPAPPIKLCTDGLIRCERNPSYSEPWSRISYGIGYGSVPQGPNYSVRTGAVERNTSNSSEGRPEFVQYPIETMLARIATGTSRR